MAFSMIAAIADLLRPRPRLACPEAVWSNLIADLRRRGLGSRESGAFLLGRVGPGGVLTIHDYLLYDDIDPDALRGWIVFDGSKMNQVWAYCTDHGLKVVADVHTHPGPEFGQSDTDQANPMLPVKGHVALIIPNFADRLYRPGEFGLYEFRGVGRWRDHSSRGARLFAIGG